MSVLGRTLNGEIEDVDTAEEENVGSSGCSGLGSVGWGIGHSMLVAVLVCT